MDLLNHPTYDGARARTTGCIDCVLTGVFCVPYVFMLGSKVQPGGNGLLNFMKM